MNVWTYRSFHLYRCHDMKMFGEIFRRARAKTFKHSAVKMLKPAYEFIKADWSIRHEYKIFRGTTLNSRHYGNLSSVKASRRAPVASGRPPPRSALNCGWMMRVFYFQCHVSLRCLVIFLLYGTNTQQFISSNGHHFLVYLPIYIVYFSAQIASF